MTTATATLNKTDSVFDCPRCDAKGYILAFRHVNNGTCFLCAGNKTISLKTKIAKRKEQPIAAFTRKHYPCGTVQEWVEFWIDGECVAAGSPNLVSEEKKEYFRQLWRWFQIHAKAVVRDVDPYGIPL